MCLCMNRVCFACVRNSTSNRLTCVFSRMATNTHRTGTISLRYARFCWNCIFLFCFHKCPFDHSSSNYISCENYSLRVFFISYLLFFFLLAPVWSQRRVREHVLCDGTAGDGRHAPLPQQCHCCMLTHCFFIFTLFFLGYCIWFFFFVFFFFLFSFFFLFVCFQDLFSQQYHC